MQQTCWWYRGKGSDGRDLHLELRLRMQLRRRQLWLGVRWGWGEASQLSQVSEVSEVSVSVWVCLCIWQTDTETETETERERGRETEWEHAIMSNAIQSGMTKMAFDLPATHSSLRASNISFELKLHSARGWCACERVSVCLMRVGLLWQGRVVVWRLGEQVWRSGLSSLLSDSWVWWANTVVTGIQTFRAKIFAGRRCMQNLKATVPANNIPIFSLNLRL